MSFTPKENVSLASLSHYHIGGPARYFADASTGKKIKDALRWAQASRVPIFVLGSGTNLLFDDAGFDGLVLRPSLCALTRDATRVTAGAGVQVKDFLQFCIDHGLSGFEWAGGLPGTIGGAVRGNAGAFKGETKDSVRSVTSINVHTIAERERENHDCDFGYRTSIFKTLAGEEIILSATFDLHIGEPEHIRAAIEEKIRYRAERHPLEYPNIGSTFKNVALELFSPELQKQLASVVKMDPFPVIPTAFLISETGLKGMTEGGAQISEKQPNFIVNIGGATARDVRTLIEMIKEKVGVKYGITLETEVQIVPRG